MHGCYAFLGTSETGAFLHLLSLLLRLQLGHTHLFLPNMFHFLLLISRQGKVRLAKWLEPYSQKERTKISQELASLLTARSNKMCNFIEWRDLKVVYKRYASLFFVAGVDPTDNELITLEIIHHYVECLDKYFGNVCELDLIFNFSKAYYILDEILLAGELEESKRGNVLRTIQASDSMAEKHPEDPKHSVRGY